MVTAPASQGEVRSEQNEHASGRRKVHGIAGHVGDGLRGIEDHCVSPAGAHESRVGLEEIESLAVGTRDD